MSKIKKLSSITGSIFVCLALITPVLAADELVALGHTTGIKLYADGVIVAGISSELSNNPAVYAGIGAGDVLQSVDGKRIDSNESLKKIVEKSNGTSLNVKYLRDGTPHEANVTPVKDGSGAYRIGIWIRDSIAGIGTLTFYDPETKTYGALGHGICDSDTNVLIPVDKGALMESRVVDVKRGHEGKPGELVGDYNLNEDFASLEKNTDSGIFGEVLNDNAFKSMKAIPTADKSEIKKGAAKIISNIEGDSVEEYDIEIVEIYKDGDDTKNMLIKITDQRLIEKTGGIVRGMSGSPILQNGRLIGAVTHVLVNDPLKGYGIFIENMVSSAKKAA